jgi:hypothetical protein
MESREWQLHFRLDAGDLSDSKITNLASGVAQKGSLSETDLASDYQNGASPPTHILEEPIQHLALAGPALELRRALGRHSTEA